MQRALVSVDPNLPFSGFYSMRDLLAKTWPHSGLNRAVRRNGGTGSAAERSRYFGARCQLVAQRTREVGIRSLGLDR